MSLRHQIEIGRVVCGMCDQDMDKTEAARWRCMNPECPLVLREWWPKFRMEEVTALEKDVPGVRI